MRDLSKIRYLHFCPNKYYKILTTRCKYQQTVTQTQICERGLEDEISDIYTGLDNHVRINSMRSSLPRQENSDIDHDDYSPSGFRISRHLEGADMSHWDNHNYHTVQKFHSSREDGILPDDKYSERHYDKLSKKKSKGYIKNGSGSVNLATGMTMPKERPRPFQVHDNERYYNHIFSLRPQRSLAKNIYSKENFQPNSLERAEI